MSARAKQLNRSRYTAWVGLMVVGAALGVVGCGGDSASSAPTKPDPVVPGPSPEPLNPEPGPITPAPGVDPAPDDLPIVDVPVTTPEPVGGFKPSEKLDLL